jgi:hypothetical protein
MLGGSVDESGSEEESQLLVAIVSLSESLVYLQVGVGSDR